MPTAQQIPPATVPAVARSRTTSGSRSRPSAARCAARATVSASSSAAPPRRAARPPPRAGLDCRVGASGRSGRRRSSGPPCSASTASRPPHPLVHGRHGTHDRVADSGVICSTASGRPGPHVEKMPGRGPPARPRRPSLHPLTTPRRPSVSTLRTSAVRRTLGHVVDGGRSTRATRTTVPFVVGYDVECVAVEGAQPVRIGAGEQDARAEMAGHEQADPSGPGGLIGGVRVGPAGIRSRDHALP